jgi:hypothetical protein
MQKQVIVNVKVSSLYQRGRIEASFVQYLSTATKQDLPQPTNTILGFPNPGVIPRRPVNVIKVYSESYVNKNVILDFIIKNTLKKFKSHLKVDTTLILVPLENVFYVSQEFAKNIPEEIAIFKNTPSGVVVITTLNKWELDLYK